MKIAYVVPYVPNLIRTRPFNLISRLTALGHEVDVFTLGTSQQDRDDAQALETKCRAVHFFVQPVWRSLLNSGLAVPSQRPLQSVYSWHPGMAQELAKRVACKQFELVHVEHLRGSRYATFIKSNFRTTPVVWDSVDCISHLFRQAAGRSSGLFGRFMTRFELARTQKAEGGLTCSFDHVLVTSSTDKNALLALVANGRKPAHISVLPNGVDLDYFRPNPQVQREPGTIVFSGKMSYHANIAMVKYLVSDIMPSVWKNRPDARLIIVGKDPSAEIKNMERNSLITVTGTVDDIRPFLWCATISIVPLLYGAGIQNKILEAMATETPVVSSPQTLSALRVQPGKELLVASDARGFAQNILELFNDRNLQCTIAARGLAYVRTNHDWCSIASQLTNIYQDTLEKNRGPVN